MNYREYRLSMKEIMATAIISTLVSGMVAFLFYQSPWAMMSMPIVFLFTKKRMRTQKIEKRMQELQEQFISGMQVLSESLQAGLSMENAWKEVEREILSLYGEGSVFLREIKEINRSVAFNVPIERLFLDFAYRSGVEDIISFAEIFDYGKRSGGNWKQIIEGTVFRMVERHEMHREIEVLLAEKKLEQRVMNVVPLGMLLFLQLSSWDYVKVLYGNPLGVVAMTICFVVYGVAMLLSEKIMRIQV